MACLPKNSQLLRIDHVIEKDSPFYMRSSKTDLIHLYLILFIRLGGIFQ